MNAAAREVMKEVPEIVLGYGMSDEFRCVFRSGLMFDCDFDGDVKNEERRLSVWLSC